jgi:hypothetical protein
LTRRRTDVGDLVATLRKRWDDGRYLANHAAGIPWTAISLPVKAPSASELLDRFDESPRWADKFHRDSRTGGGRRAS